VNENDEGKLHLKLEILNNPEPADGTSLIWVRAKVYTTVDGETIIPPSQAVTFRIEDGGDGQSNAVFAGTGTKEAYDKSNATTGWTAWRYFKSSQDGGGTVLGYLSADKNVSDSKSFMFSPAEGNLPSASVLEVYGQAYYWSDFSPYPQVIGAYVTDPYRASPYFFEPAGKDAVKIRDTNGRYAFVSGGILYRGEQGIPGTVFSVGVVDEKNEVVSLRAHDRYVCAYPSDDYGLHGYNLLVNGYNPNDSVAFFRIHDAPIPPYTLKITECPSSINAGGRAQVSGTLTGLNGPVASATCNVSYEVQGKNTLNGPSQISCVDGKFSFTVTADIAPPPREAVVVIDYPSKDYTAYAGRWIGIEPPTPGPAPSPTPKVRRVALRTSGDPHFWTISSEHNLQTVVTAFATNLSDPLTRFILIPVGANAVKIRHVASDAYVRRLGRILVADGNGHSIFAINKVKGPTDNLVTLQVDDIYVFATSNYDLSADGTAGYASATHFTIIDMPSHE
jgi:hypothetical protein